MKKIVSTFAAGVAGLLFTAINASAAPIASTTYGGHTYDLYAAQGIAWGDAEAAAQADGGYLAVLTDLAETSAVYGGLIGHGFFHLGNEQGIQAWLGGYTADLSHHTTDPNNWAWVNGDLWTNFDVHNFAGGEPNGDSLGLAINRFGTFGWNDEGGFVGGYIVEKNSVSNSVPDGGTTVALLGISLGGLAYFRRKLA